MACSIVCERGETMYYKFDAQHCKPLDRLDLTAKI